MAMGGSSNTVLHMLAIAREAGVAFDLARIDGDRRAGRAHREDRAVALDRAHRGRAPRGRRLRRAARGRAARGRRPRGRAHRHRRDARRADRRRADPRSRASSTRWRTRTPRSGGLAILFGNLAREGAVVKTAGVEPSMRRFTGAGDLLRLAGRGDRRDHGRQGEGRALRRHPLRGAEGRAGDAGDARADLADHGHGARSSGRARHRRPVLRRDARRLHRPRLSRGRRGRRDRARRRTATPSRSTSRARALSVDVTDAELARRREGFRPRTQARSAPRGSSATRCSSRTRPRARS